MIPLRLRAALLLACTVLISRAAPAPLPIKPDIVVAADGSGNFTTIQAALESIPADNRERIVVFIKDGTYHEKIRVDARCVTLRGQSRDGTRIEYPQFNDDFRKNPDKLGVAVININGDDCVIENLTAENTRDVIGGHAFTVYGTADRTVITDCNVLSKGNDTLSLWKRDTGRYYHARLTVCGSVDFICPRGWCYMVDSEMTEVNPHTDAAMRHDGSRDPDMKFVMRGCRFEGPENFRLARHHHDAQFFFIFCSFAKNMRDFAPYRVVYPLDGSAPTEADIKRNHDLDATNVWGERSYFSNCHHDGGDYAWHRDNLASAPGAPNAAQVTAKWTFAGTWDPENSVGPTIKSVTWEGGFAKVVFSENVTVKGHPYLALQGGDTAAYQSGSGSNTLTFVGHLRKPPRAPKLELDGGAIVATEAHATLLTADLTLPSP
ncbi:MAG TPA: pectinesterase family protein [Candidatus Didemnitutus sp.]|nr:pectinesterase family protein [Candidatus Didemnitutus sp.]